MGVYWQKWQLLSDPIDAIKQRKQLCRGIESNLAVPTELTGSNFNDGESVLSPMEPVKDIFVATSAL